MPKSAQQQFNEWKRYRAKAEQMIAKHEELMVDIARGKPNVVKTNLPNNILLALVKHDIKLLEETRSDIEKKTSYFRQKAHEEIIRSNHLLSN